MFQSCSEWPVISGQKCNVESYLGKPAFFFAGRASSQTKIPNGSWSHWKHESHPNWLASASSDEIQVTAGDHVHDCFHNWSVHAGECNSAVEGSSSQGPLWVIRNRPFQLKSVLRHGISLRFCCGNVFPISPSQFCASFFKYLLLIHQVEIPTVG